MAELLSCEGWRRGEEQLLMGRSMWRRQTAPRNLQLRSRWIRSWAACVLKGNPCPPQVCVAAEVSRPVRC